MVGNTTLQNGLSGFDDCGALLPATSLADWHEALMYLAEVLRFE